MSFTSTTGGVLLVGAVEDGGEVIGAVISAPEEHLDSVRRWLCPFEHPVKHP